MCFMTEHQATTDTAENSLSFEMWELIAPKVQRELADMSVVGEEDDSLDRAYVTEMQAQEVLPSDLETLAMAILKINDGKHFFETKDAPLPQSEDEIGFRRP